MEECEKLEENKIKDSVKLIYKYIDMYLYIFVRLSDELRITRQAVQSNNTDNAN